MPGRFFRTSRESNHGVSVAIVRAICGVLFSVVPGCSQFREQEPEQRLRIVAQIVNRRYVKAARFLRN